jgi:hypothetical protein
MPYARRLMLVDDRGKRVTPLSEAYGDPEHPYRDLSMREGLMVAKLIARNKETVDLCGALNRHGTVIVPFVFGNMSAFNEGAALVFTERGGGRVGILKRPVNYDEDRGGALIRVFLNDERLDFSDADPLIENGRTLVPMRGILETLGAQVDWNEQTRTVTAVKDGITISLAVGNTAAAVNGEPHNLDVPARIINNRTMVPLRFLAESLSAVVDWDGTRRVIRITA